MKRHTTLLLWGLLSAPFMLKAQDSSVERRIILMGDAGEINQGQQAVIQHAATQVLPGKTIALYLGDNIYPRGMGLPGSPEEKETQQILQSQYGPMRAKGVPVYFIPGNHDWDRMGTKGFEKIVRQGEYLEELNDSLLRLVPTDGCPGPYEIPVSDHLVIIAVDSEWWLFPFGKPANNTGCDCTNKDEVITRTEDLLYRNRNKIVLFATHHPFVTYGPHGGHFNLRQHVFPLTAVNKSLYIPLPVVGSLYPLLRTVISSPEDLSHPLYKDMISRFSTVLKHYPNVIHVSGHEHTLQLIQGDVLQVISGADSKHAPVKKGSHSLFAKSGYGYVTADVLANHQVKLTYYSVENNGVVPVFSYTKPFTDVLQQEEAIAHTPLPDSIKAAPDPSYNRVGKLHRTILGENYRKEWALPATLPVFRLSAAKGGLTPTERGGGHQTKSLRLVDKNGKEWVLRTVQKNPAAALPVQLRQTFARDIAQDNTSAAHPYSALPVPVLANATGVPHAVPVAVFVAPDQLLGQYNKDFANQVCLLEEREPYGKSENTLKMLKAVQKDNDYTVDQQALLKARLLDVFMADWDRHTDQWRWLPVKKGENVLFKPIPRDRDQVMYVNQGWLPYLVSRKWAVPFLQGFKDKVVKVPDAFFNGRQLDDQFLNNLTYQQWMSTAKEMVSQLTDSVLHTALHRLPKEADSLRHEQLYNTFRSRRDDMVRTADVYYHFLNKIVDIQTSDKNELVEIKDGSNGQLQVAVHKISKKGKIEDELYNRVLDPGETREVRIFTCKGHDSIVIHKAQSPIRVRVVGSTDARQYVLQDVSAGGVHIYEGKNNAVFTGDARNTHLHLSNSADNLAVVQTNRYDRAIPLPVIGYNLDDGLLLGMGLRFIHQGFRKLPYASSQQVSFGYSFATSAFRVRYAGEWMKALGNADIVLAADARVPDNVTNFFGRGNETPFIKTGKPPIRFYRTRYTYITVDPMLRWRSASGKSNVAIGPSVQYYAFDSSDNNGRFINNVSQIGSYDSSSVGRSKTHLGIRAGYTLDTRNNPLLPAWGVYVDIKAQAYAGLSSAAKSYAQLVPEVAFYKSLNARSTIVLANRTGGGITLGKSAFYQSLFLGGQDNLLGYRQYRFAGEHMLYNNLELRIKLKDFASYLFPGQIGLLGFYDIGRVWQEGDHSDKWHNGVGGGLYISPAQMAVIRITAGYSGEGWLPYIALNLRF